eukprot:2031292-Rhodomonas_salina.1
MVELKKLGKAVQCLLRFSNPQSRAQPTPKHREDSRRNVGFGDELGSEHGTASFDSGLAQTQDQRHHEELPCGGGRAGAVRCMLACATREAEVVK